MLTSRKQGILVLKTKYPYQMAKNGRMEDSYEVICKEITYEAENIAFDLEQVFKCALMNIAIKYDGMQKKSIDTNKVNNEGKDNKDFEKEDSPSKEKIYSNAKSLQEMFFMNDAKPISELVSLFENLLDYNLIMAEGNQAPMKKNVMWNTLNRQDRLDIIFQYIVFFVKPLAIQATGDMLTEKKDLFSQTIENVTL